MFLWFHPSLVFNTTNYVIGLLVLVSIIGDHIVAHTKLHLFQALFDNATHATIGVLSWLFVCINNKNSSQIRTLIEIACCGAIASLIDVDHFVSARSVHLKDATSLQKRPPLHCSTFPLILCIFLLLLSYVFQVEVWKKISLIMLTAFASHHIRDATRRGFWFYPFGSTQPIPYCLYVSLTCLLPIGISLLYHWVKINGSKYGPLIKGTVI